MRLQELEGEEVKSESSSKSESSEDNSEVLDKSATSRNGLKADDKAKLKLVI